MNNEFERLKKEYLKNKKIKHVIYSITLGVLLTFILFLSLHFNKFVLFTVLISGVFYLLFEKFNTPSDEEIAKYIDKKFELKEQVQTMIVFQKDENQITSKLKENTNVNLKRISSSEVGFKISLLNSMCVVLALICLTSMVVVSPKAKENTDSNSSSFYTSEIVDSNTTEENTTNQETNSMQTTQSEEEGKQDPSEAIDAIKDAINESDASQEVKDGLNEILDDLKENLEESKTDEEKEDAIKDAIEKIEDLKNKLDSLHIIGECLKKEAETIKDSNKTLYEFLFNLGESLININLESITQTFENLITFINEIKDNELSLFVESLKVSIKNVLDDVLNTYMLTYNEEFNQEDLLYKAFKDFSASLAELENATKEDVVLLLNKLKDDILEALKQQQINEDTASNVQEALENMLPSEEGEDGEDGDQEKPGEGEDGEEQNPSDSDDEKDPSDPTGGDGDGEIIYAGNDKVFTIDGYKEYGDIINDYYDKVIGTDDQEISDILEAYFASLYN